MWFSRSKPKVERGQHLVVGLGNPGRRYRGTRHNVGFELIEALAERFEILEQRQWFKSEFYTVRTGEATVAHLLKPGTYMNRSGEPTRQVMQSLGLTAEQVIVAYDDLDLTTGRLRLRGRGSSGGHRGVASILAELQTLKLLDSKNPLAFARLRIGIDRDPEVEVSEYVLAPFSSVEREQLEPGLARALLATECWIEQGLIKAMDQYNNTTPSRPSEGAE